MQLPKWILHISLCCLGLTALADQALSREAKEIGIGDCRYYFRKCETNGLTRSVILGLWKSNSPTNDLAAGIELLTLENANLNSVDADVWISTDARTICLLVGRAVGSQITDYKIIPFKLESQPQKARRYRGQFSKTTELIDGKMVEKEKFSPLSVKQVLVYRLDKRSPQRTKNVPEIEVQSIRDVLLKSTALGTCAIEGVLNNKYLFRLPLLMQDQRETISVGEIQIEDLTEGSKGRPEGLIK